LHKLEHKKFVGQVGEFKKLFDSGKAMLSMEVMSFLSDWLKNHIMKTDKQYGPFFNGKGVK
jgi:hemerythrin-like metal-binding protein